MRVIQSLQFQNPFVLDLRSLAVFRILIGLCIFFYYCSIFSDFEIFFTEQGVLPSKVLTDKFWLLNFRWSVYFLSPYQSVHYFFYFSGIILSVLLILGFRVNWISFFSWILLVSLHNRNPMILNAGDTMLQLLLFWMIFLPSGAYYSLKRNNIKVTGFFSFASAAIIVQILIIYFFSALLKTSPEWHQTGVALYQALQLDSVTTSAGKQLLAYPAFLKLLTFLVYYLELLGPLFMLLPFYHEKIRIVIPPLFILFHLGTAFLFNLGIFPFVGMTAWLLFIPSGFWQRVKLSSVLVQRRRKWYDWVAGTLIIYVFLYNWRSLNYQERKSYFPPHVNIVAQIFQIQQRWGLFAPFPTREDGWFLI